MTAGSEQYWMGRLARAAEGRVLLAKDGRYRLVGAPDLTGLDESDAIVWGEVDGDSICVTAIAEMMSAAQLAEAALFLIRTHGRGACDHARSRLKKAQESRDVRDIEIWNAVLTYITGTRLDGEVGIPGLQNRI